MRYLYILLFVFSSFYIMGQGKSEYKEKFFSNGKLMYKGMFLNGKPVGDFERHYSNGAVQAKMNYKGDYVYATLYNNMGARLAVGRYYKNKKDSLWEYYSKKKLLTKESMQNGKRDGVCKLFYSDGVLKEDCMWKDGVKHGEWTRYHTNGKKMFTTSYKRGKLNGSIVTWNYAGYKEIVGAYVNSLKEGRWKYYDANKQIKLVVDYKKGIPNKEFSKKNKDFLKDKAESEKKFIDPEKYMDYPDGYFNKIRNGRTRR